MAPLSCLQEFELIHLSRDIPHNKYSELCLALGFSYNQNQSILQKNKNDNIKAMEEILNMWNTEQADKSESRSILVKKLHDVKLYEFEQKLSKGEYPPKQQEPHEQEATPLLRSSGEYLPSQQEPHEQETTPLQSIPVIYSKKISESLNVQRCREKLENKYVNQLCKIPMKPWDKSVYAEFKDMHTVVTMVKKDARGQDMKKKEILQGAVGEIFSTKVNGRLPSRILISAPAGRGKTTAVAKMAYDWVHKEKGSALENLPLLFVVKFRNTSQRTTIGEAIKSQLLSDVDDLTPEGLESFIRENQGICHIILDGLDEYAGISSSNRSSGSNMVSVIRWEEFPECRVLVTTRPHLENFFNKDDLSTVYTKMWIEGFSQESSREYINKFFASTSSPDSGHDLKVYLGDQPLIDELAKTPLFCLMICHLWSDGSLKTETATQTELLDRVNIFLMHHANARSNSKVKKITDKNLDEIICKLGKVALAGLLDDSKKLVFTPHDFRRVPSILVRACELGILSKITVTTPRLPRSHKTTSITIDFYHKLVQEHSAGKYLAAKAKSRKRQWPCQTSNLDRVLLEINANIGDYENLIRFAAGTDNRLCIIIMEALLSNSHLDESERYRILLDCSSETNGTEENVSSFVQRCVNAQSIVLKSPTVYTVVGMQNLPRQLKREVRTLTFEGSTLSIDVTSGLWLCLRSFTSLNHLSILDSSLSFHPSPPQLPSVTKLSAERVTSQCYARVLSSVPGVKEIDVSINVPDTRDISQITTTSRPMGQTRDEQLGVHIELQAWPGQTPYRKIGTGDMIGGIDLVIGDQTKTPKRLHVSGVKGRDEETLVDLFVKTKQLTYLNSGSGGGSLNKNNAIQNTRLEIKYCHLSTEMTEKLWTSFRSLTSLNHMIISDSSLSFPQSPTELPYVKKLSAEGVTSQIYEGLLSSLPRLEEVDITIGDANTVAISQIQTSLRQHLTGHDLTRIIPHSYTSEENLLSMSTQRMRVLGLLFIRNQAILSGVVFGLTETVIDLVRSSTRLMSASLYVEQFCRSLNSVQDPLHNTRLGIEQCQLSTEMTEKLWTSLRSFTSLNDLSISDSSLSFPSSPPVLPSVTKLSVKRVTSQSYESVLSSIPEVKDIDAYIDVAETSNTFQSTTASRPTSQTRAKAEQFFVHIRLHTWPARTTDRKVESEETIGGLSLLIEDKNKDQQRLHVSGVNGRDEKALVDLFVKTKRLTYLNSESGFLNRQNAVQNARLEIENCQLSTEMTVKLWSSLRSFTSLTQLSISDSSLSFPTPPPELLSITKLSSERVTSQSYARVLASVPDVRDIDVYINVAETGNTFHSTAAYRPNITRGITQTRASDEPFFVHIRLHAWPTLTTDRQIESGETIAGLSLLIEDQTKNQQRLHVSRVNGRDEETLVDLFVKTKQLTYLNSGSGCGSLNKKNGIQNARLEIGNCHLSTEMTVKLWSSLRSFTSLNHLIISDSSLSFPLSPTEFPSVTKLSVERVTSQSYEGLLSSLPGLEEIDIIIGDANTEDISQIQTSLRRHLTGHDLTRINTNSFTSERNVSSLSNKRMRGLGLLITEWQAILSGLVSGPSVTVIDHVQTSTRLMSASLYVDQFSRSLNSDQDALHIEAFSIMDCQLSTEMTVELWSRLRSFTSLKHLTISDSSLSFPPSPPELRYVTKLSVDSVTSLSYEGLLSSLPGLREMKITIDDAERDILQIITGPKIEMLTIKDCQLSNEITVKLWSCLRSFTSLKHLTISDSSLSFPSSPPELPSVTKLSAERVTPQSYEGLFSSLPGLRYFNIDYAEIEILEPQITAFLRRTSRQARISITYNELGYINYVL